MSPQFSNMDELTAYLESLEKRLLALERENQALQDQKDSLNHYIQELGGDAQKLLPKTSLLSPSFLQRAFAVWGHYFVAQLIISIPLACVYFIIVYLMLQQGISVIPTP
jgi:hypothetical protein